MQIFTCTDKLTHYQRCVPHATKQKLLNKLTENKLMSITEVWSSSILCDSSPNIKYSRNEYWQWNIFSNNKNAYNTIQPLHYDYPRWQFGGGSSLLLWEGFVKKVDFEPGAKKCGRNDVESGVDVKDRKWIVTSQGWQNKSGSWFRSCSDEYLSQRSVVFNEKQIFYEENFSSAAWSQ